MLDAEFFQKVGPDISACYRRFIFGSADGGKSARDIFGKDYKPYSLEYRESKRTGAMFRQASQFKDSNAPVLSSDLLRDMRYYGTFSGGFGFGALSARGKINHLAKMGRVIATKQKALPDECAKKIMNEADKYVQGKLDKIKGRTFNI